MLDKKERELAQNSDTRPEVLEEIAKRCGSTVQMLVAKHENAPPDLLRYLAGQEDFGVKLYVANNPKTPPDTLDELAQLKWLDFKEFPVVRPAPIICEMLVAITSLRNLVTQLLGKKG